MDKKIVVIEYQDSFADNFSNFAYSKIMENKFDIECFYENSTKDRMNFERKMKNFNMDYSYISRSRANNIAKTSRLIDIKDLNLNKIKNNKVLNLCHFRIDDIRYITDDIKSMFNFANIDFIVNHDILENIVSSNSIGLYINKDDKADLRYIKDATKRLNKYIKHPKLFIFSRKQINIDSYIDYEIVQIYDWREEFYFLKSCKHKIIHCSDLSYSEGFWASILNNKSYYYTVFDKKLKTHNKFKNWLSV